MPLVQYIQLPTFDRLREMGEEVLTIEQAIHQDIRELHIGFLNMMPDSALAVTELQFMRLVGSCNRIAQFFVHPFSIPGLPRGPEAQKYIDEHYESFETLKEQGLDALIITGANVSNPSLEQEPFWPALQEVIEWAQDHVTSVLCSCLATHALVKHLYNIDRLPLSTKRWGVYSHRISQPSHPLLRDVNTRFDVPHSRNNAITHEQCDAAGLHVLVNSHEGGVHVAVSPDQFRYVFFQGHPEYSHNSLLKEYKREVLRFIRGERDTYPPHPEHYFSEEAAALANTYHERLLSERSAGREAPEFPEDALAAQLDNTWGDTGKSIFNNWLGLVYRLTNLDRKQPFVEGVDPNDPLQIHQAG